MWVAFPWAQQSRWGDGAVTLNATKTWDDNNDAERQRPDYVDLVVLANGQPAVDSNGNTITIRVSADSNWKGTVEGLPRYDDNGSEISYTVQEPSVPDGYTSTVGTPTVTETEGKAYWVPASTFGTSAADGDTYLVVARDVDDPTRWLGVHPEGKTASWTNKEGHSAPEIPINNQPLSVTTGGVTTVYRLGSPTTWCSSIWSVSGRRNTMPSAGTGSLAALSRISSSRMSQTGCTSSLTGGATL